MAKQLMLEGFMIKPVAHIVDVEHSTIEPIPLGEQKVKLDDLATFAEEQWPEMWGAIAKQFEATQKAEEQRQLGEAMTEGNRPTKRAAARRAPRKLAAAPPPKE